MERLARAQAAVARVELARRAEAEFEHARCEREAEDIVAALSGDTPLYGLMLPAMAKMLQANAREKTALEAAANAASLAERTERLRAERIAERALTARRLERRCDEATRLENIGAAIVPDGNALSQEDADEA